MDFSSAENLEERLKFVKERKIGIVLASTGFIERDLKLIDEYAAEVAIFKTANLSLGVNLMQALVGRQRKFWARASTWKSSSGITI
ncbi:MAG: hypothetical protein ACLRSW_02440 [Christensenellaceae bacterium]